MAHALTHLRVHRLKTGANKSWPAHSLLCHSLPLQKARGRETIHPPKRHACPEPYSLSCPPTHHSLTPQEMPRHHFRPPNEPVTPDLVDNLVLAGDANVSPLIYHDTAGRQERAMNLLVAGVGRLCNGSPSLAGERVHGRLGSTTRDTSVIGRTV